MTELFVDRVKATCRVFVTSYGKWRFAETNSIAALV